MSDLDQRISLAVEIAERNHRCACVDYRQDKASVCLLKKGHSAEHKWEDVKRVIPFDSDSRVS